MVKAGIYDNVNAALVDHYSRETGRDTWHTFADWRKAGRPVRKGESGFPIWGTPRAMKSGESSPGDLVQLGALLGVESTGPQFFPVCYLFHDGQVDEPATIATTTATTI